MKKMIFPALICTILISCENNAGEPAAATEPAAVAEPNFVSPIEYSSKFELGDPKKSEQIVQLWKDFDDNKLDDHSSYFADSVTMEFPGSTFSGPRDSMVASTKGYRGSLAGVNSKIIAVTSVKSTDKMEDWVLIWGNEYITEVGGNIDSAAIHEIWRFNKEGKVDYMGQFRRDLAPSKK